MKSDKVTFVRIAALALFSLCFASASFAATKPLSYPYGLAIDSKGNLYVANFGQNEILVYSPGYKQLTKNTITDSLSGPLGIAFDSYGDLWACNYNDSGISMYPPGGLIAVRAINNQVPPVALTIDGSNNVWVQDGVQGVGVYDQSGRAFKMVPPQSGSLGFGLATHLGWVAMGNNGGQTFVVGATPFLLYGYEFGQFLQGDGVAIAADPSDNFYIANSDGSVNIYNPDKGSTQAFVTLTFAPGGIAIDSARGRVYFSNHAGNQILVYSTAGVLLHTIQ